MASFLKRVSVVGALAAVVWILALGRTSFGALREKAVLDGINDTIAVLRYFHKQIIEIEENLELVRAARDLTQRQYEAQKRLYETEKAKGNESRAAMFKNNLDRLEGQMAKLTEFDFEKIYSDRMAEIRKKIEPVSLDLDARLTEYETLFGQRPRVDLAFEKQLQRYRGRRAEAAYFLDLD